MTAAGLASVAGVTALLAGVVGLPRANALPGLGRLQSRAWVATLPAMIIIGTLLVLGRPSTAKDLIALSTVLVVPLTTIAVVAVARGRRVLALLAPIAFALSFLRGPLGEVFASILTSLGCLTLGVGLARLTPSRWLPLGMLAMCATDVGLFASGAGQSSWGLMAQATARVHGPVFDQVTIGTMTIDYPDLVLAGALGGFAASRDIQRRAAIITATLAAGTGLSLLAFQLIPVTVPIGMTYIVLIWGHRLQPLCRWHPTSARSTSGETLPGSACG